MNDASAVQVATMSAVIEFLDRHMIAVSMVLGVVLAVVVRKRTHPDNKNITRSFDPTEVCACSSRAVTVVCIS